MQPKRRFNTRAFIEFICHMKLTYTSSGLRVPRRLVEFARGSRGKIHQAEALPMVDVTPILAVHHQSLSQECKQHAMVASLGCELTDVFGPLDCKWMAECTILTVLLKSIHKPTKPQQNDKLEIKCHRWMSTSSFTCVTMIHYHYLCICCLLGSMRHVSQQWNAGQARRCSSSPSKYVAIKMQFACRPWLLLNQKMSNTISPSWERQLHWNPKLFKNIQES